MTNIDTRNTNTWPLTHKYMTSNTQIHDHQLRNTWPLNFLAWYRQFIKKVLVFNLLMTAYLFYCEVKYFAETVLHWQFALDMFYSTCTGKCICVLGISILYLSIGFWNCSDNVFFVIFHFIITYTTNINKLNVQKHCLSIVNLYTYQTNVYHWIALQ